MTTPREKLTPDLQAEIVEVFGEEALHNLLETVDRFETDPAFARQIGELASPYRARMIEEVEHARNCLNGFLETLRPDPEQPVPPGINPAVPFGYLQQSIGHLAAAFDARDKAFMLLMHREA